MTFKNKLLKQAVNEALSTKHVVNIVKSEEVYFESSTDENIPISNDDLIKIEGIHICDIAGINMIRIPWHRESSFFNMIKPNLFVTWDMVDWDDFSYFTNIKSLYVNDSPSDSKCTLTLKLFPNLSELYLQNVMIESWEHLLDLSNIKMLMVIESKAEDDSDFTSCVGELHRRQRARFIEAKERGVESFELINLRAMDHLAAINMNISDLSFVDWNVHWTDVNLSYNNIIDITPLEHNKIEYLSLRHNKINDMKTLVSGYNYYLNVRHNNISDISLLLDKMKSDRYIPPFRLYLYNNPIPEEQIEQLIIADKYDEIYFNDFK